MAHALTKFRESRGQTLDEFAADLGTVKSSLWKWENGKAIPRAEFMRRIIEISGGEVSPNDWYAVAEAAE